METYTRLLAGREHAWETLWGAGIIGIPFGILTLYYAPSRAFLPWLIGWVVLVAGYYVWRADHVRLIPTLRLGDARMIYAPTNAPSHQRKFVQVLVKCGTESPLDNCSGQLLRVLKWSNGKWAPTWIDECLDLLCSNVDIPSLTLEPGADRQLHVIFVDSFTRRITPHTNRLPFRMALQSNPSDIYRVDVRIAAKDCPPEYLSLKISVGEQWDDLTLERIENALNFG